MEKKQNEKRTAKKNRWIKFTYCRKGTSMVTKLFKNTNVKVAYRTKNNLEKLLIPQKTPKRDKYEKSGVYQLECLTCHKIYIGQTDRPSVQGRANITTTLNTQTTDPHSPKMSRRRTLLRHNRRNNEHNSL